MARARPLPRPCNNLTGQQALTRSPFILPWQGWVAGYLFWLMDQNIIPLTSESQTCPNLPHCDCTAAFQCQLYVEPEPERLAPWIGVDLDGCLAEYTGYKGPTVIGAPVAKMLQRVKTMLAQGKNVKIFTARCWSDDNSKRRRESLAAIKAIEDWCQLYVGQVLPVTCVKDYGMTHLYDDRAIQVEPNTGDTLEDKIWRLEHNFNRTSPRQG